MQLSHPFVMSKTENRIHISLNMAMTLDGKVMLPDGGWHDLTSRKDREQMDVYRRLADVLIVGKNSVVNDDPIVTVKGKSPIPVMILRSGFPPIDRRIFQNQIHKPILFIVDSLRETPHVSEFEKIARCIFLTESDLGIVSILERLKGMGYGNGLLEGGPRLNHAFFAVDAVDRIHLTLVPFLIGKKSLSGIVDGEQEFEGFIEKKWKRVDTRPVDDEVFFTFDRIR